MRIYLLNDTSAEHAGCNAVMRSIRAACTGHDIIAVHRVGELWRDLAAIKACDAVLVNGEGTIHHRAEKGRFLLEVLREAQELGKKTLLVNALFQEEPPFYPDVLRNLDYFSVREPMSAQCARRCGGNPVVRLDSCAGIDLSAGASFKVSAAAVRGDTHPAAPTHGLLEKLDLAHLGLGGRFEDVVATLKTCRLYVTGQHHGVYAAGLAGIPFVPVVSNSHKIESLIEWSALPIPVCRTLEEVQQGIEYALNHPEVYEEFHDFLMSRRPFGAGDLNRVLSRTASTPPPRDETAPERLRRVIGGRPVGVLLHGPSVNAFKERAQDFADKEMAYGSINFFRVMEEDILAPIGRDLDFVYCSSEEELPRRLRDIETFLALRPFPTKKCRTR